MTPEELANRMSGMRQRLLLEHRPGKRMPRLLDRFLANDGSMMVRDREFLQIRNAARQARHFVLDEAGSRRYGEVIRDKSDLIVREHMFARAPFERTFVEFDFKTFFQVVNGREAFKPVSDQVLGFLIDHDTAYVVMEVGDLMPFAYDLQTPWPVEDQTTFAATTHRTPDELDMFLWGSTYTALDGEARQLLRAHHTVRMLPVHDMIMRMKIDREHVFTTLFHESFADLRNILGLLLLLNRPTVTIPVADVAAHKTFVKGKPRTFMAYTKLTIHVDPQPILNLIGTPADDDIEKRRHDVRGTWCHDRAYHAGSANGCVHEWVAHPKYSAEKGFVDADGQFQRDNWQCVHCHGHRWRRDQHERGNAAVGVVDKAYKVTQ